MPLKELSLEDYIRRELDLRPGMTRGEIVKAAQADGRAESYYEISVALTHMRNELDVRLQEAKLFRKSNN